MAITDSTPWGSDAQISMPVPPAAYLRQGPNFPMQGFLFTVNGLSHDITESEREQILNQNFVPQRLGDITWG